MEQKHQEHELRAKLAQAEEMLQATHRRRQHPAVIAKFEKIRDLYLDELHALDTGRRRHPWH